MLCGDVLCVDVVLFRRINHSYFRQLWDEDYEEIVAADLEMEEYFRKVVPSLLLPPPPPPTPPQPQLSVSCCFYPIFTLLEML